MAAAPPIIAKSRWPDPKVERSIFGTADPGAIWEQVLEMCPEAVGCFAFRVSIGALFGLELRDGSRVALKIHTGARTRPSTSRRPRQSRSTCGGAASRA